MYQIWITIKRDANTNIYFEDINYYEDKGQSSKCLNVWNDLEDNVIGNNGENWRVIMDLSIELNNSELFNYILKKDIYLLDNSIELKLTGEWSPTPKQLTLDSCIDDPPEDQITNAIVYLWTDTVAKTIRFSVFQSFDANNLDENEIFSSMLVLFDVDNESLLQELANSISSKNDINNNVDWSAELQENNNAILIDRPKGMIALTEIIEYNSPAPESSCYEIWDVLKDKFMLDNSNNIHWKVILDIKINVETENEDIEKLYDAINRQEIELSRSILLSNIKDQWIPIPESIDTYTCEQDIPDVPKIDNLPAVLFLWPDTLTKTIRLTLFQNILIDNCKDENNNIIDSEVQKYLVNDLNVLFKMSPEMNNSELHTFTFELNQEEIQDKLGNFWHCINLNVINLPLVNINLNQLVLKMDINRLKHSMSTFFYQNAFSYTNRPVSEPCRSQWQFILQEFAQISSNLQHWYVTMDLPLTDDDYMYNKLLNGMVKLGPRELLINSIYKDYTYPILSIGGYEINPISYFNCNNPSTFNSAAILFLWTTCIENDKFVHLTLLQNFSEEIDLSEGEFINKLFLFFETKNDSYTKILNESFNILNAWTDMISSNDIIWNINRMPSKQLNSITVENIYEISTQADTGRDSENINDYRSRKDPDLDKSKCKESFHQVFESLNILGDENSDYWNVTMDLRYKDETCEFYNAINSGNITLGPRPILDAIYNINRFKTRQNQNRINNRLNSLEWTNVYGDNIKEVTYEACISSEPPDPPHPPNRNPTLCCRGAVLRDGTFDIECREKDPDIDCLPGFFER